ncbi:hypothetical protein M378DRAFT_159716 [Amanita muscaria Koide BX008]|uniref:Nephrocystin 3-like N-terminal domain-containing protein n=1 Tax=Amanita muscaria (strain Koide BX008) TaxID=946122 RepID=A0A0C2WZP4_AMAMK|nr:hypothetical protein M378DRAFT_159716 [Amanita muscaria Koide BX008]
MVCSGIAQALQNPTGVSPQLMFSGASRQAHQPLDNSQTNNQNNFIAEGSHNIFISNNNAVISNNILNSGANQIVNFGSYNIVNSGSNSYVNTGIIIWDDSEDTELDELLNDHVSKDALRNSFHSPPECHPNTRKTVCKEIGEWIDDSESKMSSLLWLNGPPAVGKSVIAKTVSSFHHQVVATFFFSTSSDRSAATLFPTLAWQLARRIPDTRKHIIASLKNSDLLRPTRIEEQFDLLILQPLKKTTTLGSRPVMVIDGVDQCTDERMLGRFLRVLVQAGEGDDMPLRFIICSRREPRIDAILHKITNSNSDGHFFRGILHFAFPSSQVCDSRSGLHPHMQWSRIITQFLQDVWELYRPIRLGVDKDALPSPSDTCVKLADTLDRICPHPVTPTIQIGFSKECEQDIARYLEDRFDAIRQPGDSTYPWYQPCNISDLVEASCGQFLYASTIVRLLEEPHSDPRDILEMAHHSSLQAPGLNGLYKAILKRAHDTLRNQAKEDGPDPQTELRFLMDLLAILKLFAESAQVSTISKSFPVIESLLGLERGRLTMKLRKLHSILRIIPGESIQVHHRSFLEFLQNRQRSGEYHISYSTALRRILVLMGRAGLRYNIFKNNDSGRLYIQDMAVAFRRNFFERSRFPNVLYRLHILIHLLIFVLFFALLFSHMPLALSDASLAYISFAGSFLISLTTYTLFLNHSMIVPFFHPFLHPFFLVTGGFLRPLPLASLVALTWLTGLALRL